MERGSEDVVAGKALETGCLTTVTQIKQSDTELGNIKLEKTL
jgi:hypothetical protein